MASWPCPWLDSFLESVQEEYKQEPPQWTLVEPEKETYAYIFRVGNQEDPFDTLGLKKDCVMLLKRKQATLYRCVCPLGEILLVSINKDPTKQTWNVWWRCIRLLLSNKKKVNARIVLFGHPQQRIAPTRREPIQEAHVNGGATYPCDETAIVIYRKEEITRVLVHELFHASCSDPYEHTTPHIEADTEAWAELTLCAMAAKGSKESFLRHMNKQIKWSVNQAAYIQQHHGVDSEKDYAWRYLVGRLSVWESLGIPIPRAPSNPTNPKSLRFTICEPDDI